MSYLTRAGVSEMPTESNLDQELLVILADYSNDVHTLTKRGDLLPVQGAIIRIKQAIDEHVIEVYSHCDYEPCGKTNCRLIHFIKQKQRSALYNLEETSNENS